MKERSLYDNLCKRDIAYDTKHLYTVRREKLNPWFPLDGVLHISGIGMFECSDDEVTFTNMDREVSSIKLNQDPYGIVCSLMELSAGELDYQDVMIVLSKELTILFNSTSGRYTRLCDYPDLVHEVVHPKVMYKGDDFYFFLSETKVGFKGFGDKEFVTTELTSEYSRVGLLSYVALAAGYKFTGKKVEKICSA